MCIINRKIIQFNNNNNNNNNNTNKTNPSNSTWISNTRVTHAKLVQMTADIRGVNTTVDKERWRGTPLVTQATLTNTYCSFTRHSAEY